MILNNLKKNDWGQPIILTPEQIILWLEGHRRWMHEVWTQNPGTREQWIRINEDQNLNQDNKKELSLVKE